MRPRRRDVVAALAALPAGLAGCVQAPAANEFDPGPGDSPDDPRPDATDPGSTADPDEADLDRLVRASTAFALDLHGWLVEESPAENLVASPYSVSVALAMTWAGARGETESQMADALRFPLGQDLLHAAVGDLDRRVDPSAADDPPVTLETANAVWGQAGYPFADDYLGVLDADYGAGLRTVDFRADPDRARRRINEWVAERTAGEIEDLLPGSAVTPMTRLVLTNAVYFDGRWRDAFDASATDDEAFTALDGSTATVPTMHQTESFPYAEVDGHQVVELPYEGGDVGMVVVLPAAGEFESFERSLTADRLATLLDALEPTGLELALPKFTDDANVSLVDALSALGMPAAFDPEAADFSGMVEGDDADLHVDDVVHETFVDVDEDGTEAAAATGVSVGVTSATAAKVEMTVDRPFLYLVRHRPTGAVLFLGRVVDAGAAQ